MAFERKLTAAENLAKRVEAEQAQRDEAEKVSQSEMAVEAAQRLRELQAAFSKPEVKAYFSDDVNRVITELIELYKRLSDYIKDAFGIDTSAIKFISVYNASERAITEKQQETDRAIKELEGSIALKKRELEQELADVELAIKTETAKFEATKQQNIAQVAVSVENYRKQELFKVEQEIQALKAKAQSDIANEWDKYRDDVRQLRKDQASIKDLQDKLAAAEKHAAEAETAGYNKGVKETNAAKEIAINSIASKKDNEIAMLTMKLNVSDERVEKLEEQLEAKEAQLAAVNAKLVEMATAQFKQPTVAVK
jgi:hypothetical protein